MRIFVALPLPGNVASEISRWQKPLENRYGKIKWVRTENSHLTLRFFGDIDEGIMHRIRHQLSIWHPGPISFRLDKFGTFGPRNSPPTVIWLGGTFPKALSDLAGGLGLIPDQQGRIDNRRFLPHITVARIRGSTQLPPLNDPDPIEGEFDQVRIYNSNLTPDGPVYSTVDRYDLRREER